MLRRIGTITMIVLLFTVFSTSSAVAEDFLELVKDGNFERVQEAIDKGADV